MEGDHKEDFSRTWNDESKKVKLNDMIEASRKPSQQMMDGGTNQFNSFGPENGLPSSNQENTQNQPQIGSTTNSKPNNTTQTQSTNHNNQEPIKTQENPSYSESQSKKKTKSTHNYN